MTANKANSQISMKIFYIFWKREKIFNNRLKEKYEAGI